MKVEKFISLQIAVVKALLRANLSDFKPGHLKVSKTTKKAEGKKEITATLNLTTAAKHEDELFTNLFPLTTPYFQKELILSQTISSYLTAVCLGHNAKHHVKSGISVSVKIKFGNRGYMEWPLAVFEVPKREVPKKITHNPLGHSVRFRRSVSDVHVR